MPEYPIEGIGRDGHFVDAKNTECADDQETTNRSSERLADLLALSYEPMFAWRLDGLIEFWNTGRTTLRVCAERSTGALQPQSPANRIPNRVFRAALKAGE